MSRNGFGTFAVINPVLIGALRSSSAVNQDCSDMGTEITNTVALDGQTTMTGPFKAIDGTRSLPGIAFAEDRNTGFRRSAVDEMRWVGGGQDRFYFDKDGKGWLLGAADIAGAQNIDGAVTGPASDPVLISKFATNGMAKRTGDPTWAPEPMYYALDLSVGGFEWTLDTGILAELQCPVAGTITSGALQTDQTGSCAVDVRKSTYASYSATVPGSAESICGGNPLAITSGVGSLDATLTGWTTAVAAGDVLRFYLASNTAATRLHVTLQIKRVS